MAIPRVYRKSPTTFFNTFDFIEAVTATGYVDYDLFNFDSAGDGNSIISNSSRSKNKELTQQITVGADYTTKTQSTNFDSNPSSRPFELKGVAYLDCSWGTTRTAVAGNWTATMTAKLYKYDGSTETLIADSNVTKTITGTDTQVYTENATIAFTVPRTRLKAGEQIRLKITQTLKRDAGSSSVTLTNFIGRDPANRAGNYIVVSGGTYQTKTKFLCPFRIIQ
jgi:hypothetical protein